MRELLEGGSLCFVGVETARGLHLTPTVFALSSDRLWLTTSRRSVKARTWRNDRRIAGLVRVGDRAVSFTGTVRTYDLLEPTTWVPSLFAAPTLTRASVRFTAKNARFFAGYAVDARHVPFAWTPPGRVFVRVELDRAAVIAGDGTIETWGVWNRGAGSVETFRENRSSRETLSALPHDVARSVGDSGRGALAVEGDEGAIALPVWWAVDEHGVFAALAADAFELAGASARPRVALTIDQASWWRARNMVGAMLQGDAESFVLDRLRSGGRSAAARVRSAGADPSGAALIRINPDRLVWWRGWSSGTVANR